MHGKRVKTPTDEVYSIVQVVSPRGRDVLNHQRGKIVPQNRTDRPILAASEPVPWHVFGRSRGGAK